MRAYGAGEIASGTLTLSLAKDLGLCSRAAGDGFNLTTGFTALHPSNPKKGNAVLTLVMLADITAIDVISANAFTTPHMRKAVA